MIKIEFSLAIALYVILVLCSIFISWMIVDKKRNLPGPSSPEKDFFWQCGTCTYVYIDTTHGTISTCPRCGSYNKREEA